jgi:hypothetical protein
MPRREEKVRHLSDVQHLIQLLGELSVPLNTGLKIQQALGCSIEAANSRQGDIHSRLVSAATAIAILNQLGSQTLAPELLSIVDSWHKWLVTVALTLSQEIESRDTKIRSFLLEGDNDQESTVS